MSNLSTNNTIQRALYFMYYSAHKSLSGENSRGITHAMAAGVSDYKWTIEEIGTTPKWLVGENFHCCICHGIWQLGS